MGNNPSEFKGNDSLPVEGVSWYDVNEFIKILNAETGKEFRLPTEAEWEFAARGGMWSKGYMYSGSNELYKVAWYEGNSNDMPHPVKGRKANELGLYDMSGNVLEWCSDLYGDYRSNAQEDPQGPFVGSQGTQYVLRGGSWSSSARSCRVTCRYFFPPDSVYKLIGFRLALCP